MTVIFKLQLHELILTKINMYNCIYNNWFTITLTVFNYTIYKPRDNCRSGSDRKHDNWPAYCYIAPIRVRRIISHRS